RPVVLYIGQTLLPADRLCHRLIHKQDEAANKRLLESVMAESEKIWHFCRENGPKLEIALDGQLSNWVLMNDSDQTLYYIDTSTPFVRKTKAHQLDSDLLVKTMPNLLRRFIKEDTINEVLDRYYDPRKNMIDLAANLFKEQRPELVPLFVETINHNLPSGLEPITLKNVKSYYREDKAIWALFLRLRKMDRWLTTNIQRRRYEFILPGKIKR
ncbi:MAG: hypothetical protein GY866_40935, partial [Proteobacteria bacterium]|nr:hypothetical protein [Pseudomonadota bacterium]